MVGFKDITVQRARTLPVFILADTSGSMDADGKIDALNTALKEMIRSLGAQSRVSAEIWVAIITFGREATVHTDLQPAYQYEEIPVLTANGGTPFGQALNLMQQILEDKDRFPEGAYVPTIVVISDGQPTDSWEPALESLLSSSRATRLAMGIGPDKVDEVLAQFINDPDIPVVGYRDARDIEKFFKCVSMSVTQRSVQADPDSISKNEIKDLYEEEDLDF